MEREFGIVEDMEANQAELENRFPAASYGQAVPFERRRHSMWNEPPSLEAQAPYIEIYHWNPVWFGACS